jgi:G3E family GTPase
LAQATERLVGQGKRVGLVTNDQAANLVDTAVLQRSGAPVQEVAGGCFCCRFEDLLASLDKLRRQGQPEVLIGEPVGSCTDLSATVLQPIKDAYRDRFRVAPFSVLVDVRQVRTLDRLRRSLADKTPSRLPASVMYIYQKQLEEADLIVLNKADLLSPAELAEIEGSLKEAFPRAPVLAMSALRGEGIDRWLDFVTQDRPAGQTIAEVDYDTYAAGEAALGWLNAAVRLVADGDADWGVFCRELLVTAKRRSAEQSAQIAHLKLHLTANGQTLTANLTASDDEPRVRGTIEGSAAQAWLLLNARAPIEPESLRELVRRSLETAARGRARFVLEEWESFAPARPQPRHRYDRVV